MTQSLVGEKGKLSQCNIEFNINITSFKIYITLIKIFIIFYFK